MAISTELIDARDNSHIWGQQYSRKSADIIAVQGDIAKEMTVALRIKLSGENEKRIAKINTANPDAYQDYLKGLYWDNKSNQEGLNKGVKYFQQAIEKDPTYALAYAGLADCYGTLANLAFGPPKENYARAKEATLKALEIDDTLGEAHAYLGNIRAVYDWDVSGAEREFHRALELNPNYAVTHFYYGVALEHEGRLAEAINEEKRAVELDPLSLPNNYALGAAFYFARQFDQAIDQERKTLELDPTFELAHVALGRIYVQKAMFKASIAETEKALAISTDNLGILSDVAYVYAVAGRKVDAQKLVDHLNKVSRQRYVQPLLIARAYVGLGEKDKAFAYLEKSYEDRSIALGFGTINVDPTFDRLRPDPRFQDLLRRTNLQP